MARGRRGNKSKQGGPPFHADGSDSPDHPNRREHARAILAGVPYLDSHNPQDIPAISPYYTIARGLGTLVSPYLNLEEDIGMNILEEIDLSVRGRVDYTMGPEIEQVATVMPGPGRQFMSILIKCWKIDQEKTKKFLQTLQLAYRGGIEYTTNQFKNAALTYVLKDPLTDRLSPHLIVNSHKSLRGFNHNDFGRAIVPFKYRAKYDEDPEAFRAQVFNSTITLTALDFPSLLYSDEMEYDEHGDPGDGLGTGHIFQRFLNHELVGLSGAYGEKPSSNKASKACLWGVTEVTSHIVASVTVSAVIACSSMAQWGWECGTVDLSEMHDHIVELLGLEGEKAKEILKAITECVPYLNKVPQGRKPKKPKTARDPNARTPADIAREKRQLPPRSPRRSQSEEAQQTQQSDEDEDEGSNGSQHGAQSGEDDDDDEAEAPPPKKKKRST